MHVYFHLARGSFKTQWATWRQIAPLGGTGHIWGLTKLKSAANDLPYASQAALGLLGSAMLKPAKSLIHACLLSFDERLISFEA